MNREITSELGNWQAIVGDWHRDRFGEEIPETWLGLKLAEETGEACRALLADDGEPQREGRRPGSLPDEAADVLIVLLALADRGRFDLDRALRDRWPVVRDRALKETG